MPSTCPPSLSFPHSFQTSIFFHFSHQPPSSFHPAFMSKWAFSPPLIVPSLLASLYCIIPFSTFSVLPQSLGHLISLFLPPWPPKHKAWNSLYPFITLLLVVALLFPYCPISKLSLCLLSFSSPLSLPFLSQRLIHSRMALFPHWLSDNIKIQNGQLNPSSISDLIVMVLPSVPGRPLLPHQPGLYDTKWPGYNFSIYSKNSVNNSFWMRRLRSLGRVWPGLSPLCSQGSQYTEKDAGLNRKWKRLINLSEFTVPLPPFCLHSNWQSQRDKNVIFTTSHGESAQ